MNSELYGFLLEAYVHNYKPSAKANSPIIFVVNVNENDKNRFLSSQF